jgi:hexosaminidase
LKQVLSASEPIFTNQDESYSLVVTLNSITITAKTIFGAIYGLETFSQLVQYNFVSQRYEIGSAPWNIMDFPQFQYRGILIDTSRHYYPLSTLKRAVDALGFAKLNVLHW